VAPYWVICLGRGEGSKLGDPCQKVRLSQDRMTILIFPCRIVRLGGKDVSWVREKEEGNWKSPSRWLLSGLFVRGGEKAASKVTPARRLG
jgi:hypothetical protein